MNDELETAFETKCDILADLWLEHKRDEEFREFVEYNDIGLPLAYMLSADIVKVSDKAEMFVNETFSVLLAGLGRNDENYDSLDDIIGGY